MSMTEQTVGIPMEDLVNFGVFLTCTMLMNSGTGTTTTLFSDTESVSDRSTFLCQRCPEWPQLAFRTELSTSIRVITDACGSSQRAFLRER